MSFLTLEKFLIIPFESYQISVIKFETKKFITTYIRELLIYNPELNISNEYLINRRYSEFRILYETIMKLIDKEETRLKYFNLFLNTIYEVAKNNIKFKKDLLIELYKFLFKDYDFKMNDLNENQIKKVFKINSETNEKILNENNLFSNDYLNDIKNKIENFKSNFDLTNFSSNSTKNNLESTEIFLKTVNKKDPNKFNIKTKEWNDILVKSSFEEFKIKIHNQILFLYENSTNANFYIFFTILTSTFIKTFIH